MDFTRILIKVAFLIGLLAGTACAQDQSIGGPTLGFAIDRNATAITPIFGVVGASLLGEPLDFGIDIRNAVISAEKNYALAVRNDSGTLVVLRLLPNPQTVTELPATDAGMSRIAISPKGTAAVFFNGASSFRTFRGLPDSPQMFFEFDTSILPGQPTTIAVSDDGNIILATLVDESGQDTTWVVTSSGAVWQAPVEHASSVAFLRDRYDAVVADAADQEVFLLLDLDQAGSRIPLASLNGPAATSMEVEPAQDGSFFVVTSGNPDVTIIDAASLTSTVIDCSCLPRGLRRLSGNGLFLLDGFPSDLLHVLDASAEPRVVVLPAKQNPPEPVVEETVEQ